MVGRADCPTPDVVSIPLVSVHSWYDFPNPDGFIYPAGTYVRLSIPHFRSLPVIYVRIVCCVYLCSMFVENHVFSRVKFLLVIVSTYVLCSSSLVPNVLLVSPNVAGLTRDLVHTIGLAFVFHFIFRLN